MLFGWGHHGTDRQTPFAGGRGCRYPPREKTPAIRSAGSAQGKFPAQAQGTAV